MTAPDLPLRQAVRAVMIDPSDRLLLVKLDLPFKGWIPGWVLPGGGIEPGEEPVDALRRELAEETGLVDPFIGPIVCHRRMLGAPSSAEFGGQEEVIHLVPCHDFVLAPALDEDELRAEGIVDMRWFDLAQLQTFDEPIFPSNLDELFQRVLEHGGSIDPLIIETGA